MTSKKPQQNQNAKKTGEAEDFHIEEIIDRPFSRVLARRLMKYLSPYKHLVLLSMVLILCTTLLSLVGPLLVKEAIDGPLRYLAKTTNLLLDSVISLSDWVSSSG